MSIIFCCFCCFMSNRLFCFHRLPVFFKRNQAVEAHRASKNTRKHKRDEHKRDEGRGVKKTEEEKKIKMTPPHQWQWGTVLLLMGICVIGISAQGTIFLHIRKWLIK